MSEVKPALTAEEWAWVREQDERDPGAGAAGYAFSFAGGEDYRRHGTAAACLHGQPFGFTHDHVHALEQAITDWESEAGDLDDPDPLTQGATTMKREEHRLMLEAVANLRALLPPEAP